jgi:hypothetical protein
MPGTLLKLYGKHRVFESVLIIMSSSAIITFGKSYTLKGFREHNAFDGSFCIMFFFLVFRLMHHLTVFAGGVS